MARKRSSRRRLVGSSTGVVKPRTKPILNSSARRSGRRSAAVSLLAIAIDEQADRLSVLCRWDQGYSKISNTFARFALPMMWDFCEGNPLSATTGNWLSCNEWVAETVEHVAASSEGSPHPRVLCQSALDSIPAVFDAVVTDPPYYDAIPYSDLMDFFYLWIRRSLAGTPWNVGGRHHPCWVYSGWFLANSD